MTVTYGRLSQWREPAEIDELKARELVARLELRARAADETAARAEYLGLLGLAPGERVLDVGCGSGAVTRDIARRIAPGGEAVGVDACPHFLALALELAEREGVAGAIVFREGDARALPFAGASFDAVLAATVLAHIPDGEAALAEMVRVARPGGRVGVFDFDGDSFLVAHPDRELTRRIVAASSDHAAVDGWLARRLPGLLARVGLRDVGARAFMPLEREASGFYAKLAERAADVAQRTGAISEAEGRRWLEELRAEQAAGAFLGGRLHIFAWGTRPAPG